MNLLTKRAGRSQKAYRVLLAVFHVSRSKSECGSGYLDTLTMFISSNSVRRCQVSPKISQSGRSPPSILNWWPFSPFEVTCGHVIVQASEVKVQFNTTGPYKRRASTSFPSSRGIYVTRRPPTNLDDVHARRILEVSVSDSRTNDVPGTRRPFSQHVRAALPRDGAAVSQVSDRWDGSKRCWDQETDTG